jgi:hypothetical protein
MRRCCCYLFNVLKAVAKEVTVSWDVSEERAVFIFRAEE